MVSNLHTNLAGRHFGLLTASASRRGGGVFEAVVAQAALLRGLGARVSVFTLADPDTVRDQDRFAPSEVIALPIKGPAQIGFAPGLVDALVASGIDCLHLHGIWMYPSRAGSQWAKRTGRPYIVSPHGMLDPWITARGRWKKALARAGYERASWRRAAAIHALTAREAADIARESGRSDSLVIPNPGPAADPGAETRERVVFYIGRVHPKKNLLALVEGWSRARLPADARLVIAGWGDEASVAALRAAIGSSRSIEFIGPCFGADKDRRLREARFTILPSFSEGLPMSVLEGWAAGTPAILTPECNLPEGPESGAAIPCGYDAASIAASIQQALAIDHAAWLGMSQAALALARGPFSGQAVASAWQRAYADVLAGTAEGNRT